MVAIWLQPLVKDYPALRRNRKWALKDQYAVKVIQASDTGYQVSANTTPTNLLRNVWSPSCAQNTGMTDPPNLKIFRLYGITMHTTHHRVKPWWYWSHLWRVAGLHWNTDRLRICLVHFYSLSVMSWCGFQWLCHCDTKCRARGVGGKYCMERNSWAQQYLVLHRLPGILYQNQLEVLLYMWGRKVIAINYRVQKYNLL